MIRAARRPAATLLLVIWGASSACNSWRVQPVAPEMLLGEAPPSTMRVRLQDTTRLVLKRPRLVADSVTGTSHGAPRTVPLSAITEVAVRRFSAGRTVGMVAIGVGGLFALAAAVCASGGCVPSFQLPTFFGE
ncbi:MAG: hypothetical protein ABIQ49_10095 [Gemmatimonadales bacterium]